MGIVNVIAVILMLVGALNWGMVGFFNYNVINAIFGGMPYTSMSGLSRIIYAVVGLAGVWGLSFLGKLKCMCGSCNHHKK